jgi:hypothetical protein
MARATARPAFSINTSPGTPNSGDAASTWPISSGVNRSRSPILFRTDFEPDDRSMKKHPGCEAAHTIVSRVSLKSALRAVRQAGIA